MHTVRGVPRHGLLVDPGAARGLMGITTVNEFEAKVLAPLGHAVGRKNSTAMLSGIEGRAQPAHSKCSIPLGLDGDVVYFQCDTIGGAFELNNCKQ